MNREGKEKKFMQIEKQKNSLRFQIKNEINNFMFCVFCSVDNQLKYAQTQLDKLKKTNVFNTTFHIWLVSFFTLEQSWCNKPIFEVKVLNNLCKFHHFLSYITYKLINHVRCLIWFEYLINFRHSGHFGTINNFRLGRLPSVPVSTWIRTLYIYAYALVKNQSSSVTLLCRLTGMK